MEFDNIRYKKPTALSAQKYIEHLMDWIETQINNESVFPVSTGGFRALSAVVLENYSFPDFISDVPFPKNFSAISRKILTRLFRVFVHVYIHHFDRIVSIGAVSFTI